MESNYLEKIFNHINKRMDFLSEVPEAFWSNTIIPKEFTVEKISQLGKDYLSFKKRDLVKFNGTLMTQRWPGGGRVFFFPYIVVINNNPSTKRFIEIKGYGQDGREMCLWLHSDGYILFGMFYKNAKKEFKILEEAYSAGLKVPLPLFLGKFSKEEWLKSGLEVVKHLAKEEFVRKINFKDLLKKDLKSLEETIIEVIKYHSPTTKNPLSAFSQTYNAGVVGRAPFSPFRIGDPKEKYDINKVNTGIAKECGKSFIGLIDLGYFHLSPGTANWTTAKELTDMADCYDLKKDKNLKKIIKNRESDIQKDFWEDLIGPRHCGNLYPFFIEGMFGESVSLEEASKELKSKLNNFM